MNDHTSIISVYKMKHLHFHPHPHKICAFYSSEKMVFSRTLHNPTRTNKMGEAKRQLYHRLQINMPESFPFNPLPLPMQIPKSRRNNHPFNLKYIFKENTPNTC